MPKTTYQYKDTGITLYAPQGKTHPDLEKKQPTTSQRVSRYIAAADKAGNKKLGNKFQLASRNFAYYPSAAEKFKNLPRRLLGI